MRKMGRAGLALAIAGALIFGAGFIGAGGDMSVVNGSFGPISVHLPATGGTKTTNGIGGGRDKPVTTPPPTHTDTVDIVDGGHHDGHEEQHHAEDEDCRSFPGEDLRKMKLDINYADVVLQTSFDTNVYVYSEKLDDFRFSTDKKGVLSIESRDMKTVWGINLGASRPTLTVAVPAALDSLEADVSCGNIELEEMSLGKLCLDSNMGDVYAHGVECRSAELSCDCGSVQALNIICSEKLEAESDMGDVTVEKCEVGGKLKAESSCGKVTVNGCTAADAELSSDMGDVIAYWLSVTDRVKLDCDCGAIEFTGLTAGKSIEIDNSMGAISGTLPGSMTDYSIEAGTDLGSCNLPSKLELGNIKLKVHDSCGSIDVKFEED